MITVHKLKTWPAYFYAVTAGTKTFEIRKNDRDFKAGDVLRLLEYDPERDEYSGRALDFTVGYVTAWMQQPGYVVLSLTNAGHGPRDCGEN